MARLSESRGDLATAVAILLVASPGNFHLVTADCGFDRDLWVTPEGATDGGHWQFGTDRCPELVYDSGQIDLSRFNASIHAWAPQIRHFEISECNLACVDQATMALPTPEAVTQISLRDNQMSFLAGDALVGFVNVVKMTLGDNRLTVLPAELLADMPALTELDVFNNRLSTILNGTFDSQSVLLLLDLSQNMLTSVETGAMDGLVAIRTINLEDNRLPTIPAALGVMRSLEFLRLARNRVTQVLAGDLEGLPNLFSLHLHSNILGQLDPAAFDNLTSMAVLPEALTQSTYHPKFPLPVTGAQIVGGGFGGRAIKTTALTLSSNPLECRWVGPTVKDVSCTECTFGYEPDPTDPNVCVLPEFHPSVDDHPALDAEFFAALGDQVALHVGQLISLPPPLLEPRKTKFRGYAAQDFNAIHYELEFPGSPVDLGCDRPVIGDTSQDDAIRVAYTNVYGWDAIRNRVGLDDRPKVFRINVTQAGNFTFDSCDSFYDTTLWLFRRDGEDAILRLTNRLYSGDTWPDYFMGAAGPSFDPATGAPSNDYSWYGGCELSSSARRSVRLEPGEHELIVRGSPFVTDLGGVYVIKMDCHGDASATSPSIADPGGITVDRLTGAISGQPHREGVDFTMRLVAVDGAGARAEIDSWTFDVTNPQFKVNLTAWPAPTVLNVSRNVQDKYHVNEPHFIEPPGSSNEAIFQDPAQGGFANITFGLSVIPDAGNTPCQPESVVLTQFQTGAASINIPCGGNYTARIIARDLAGTDADLDEWSFQVLPRDTDVDSHGPNGVPCESGSAVDGTPMDQSFTCSCPSGHAGANCQYSDASTCNGDGAAQADGSCECSDGYAGANCEYSDAITCYGDGAAQADGSCACNDGYAGANCENSGESNVNSGESNVFAIVVSTVLGLVLVAGGLAFEYRRREQRKPHDFSAQLSQLGDVTAAGRADGPFAFAQEGSLVPIELSRGSVKLLSILGSGQFGEVREGLYHTKGTSMNAEFMVAVKTLKGEPATHERDEFFREALITRQFDHQNVIGLIGVVTSGQPMLMILQYCSNGALDRLLATTPDITTEALTEYIEGIAEGMHYLASKKFCHRDLAARNVLVSADENPKIADFGLSRDLEQQEFYQQANANAKLPLRWCAPEVLDGLKFSEASDVWSYGVVIDEVYNRGAFPYPGWNNARVIQSVADGYCLPQAQGCPDLVYQRITQACLKQKPDKRPSFEAICKVFSDIKTRKLWRKSSILETKPRAANENEQDGQDGRISATDVTINTYLEPVPVRRGDTSYVDDVDADDKMKYVDEVPMTQKQFDSFGGLAGSEKQIMVRDMKCGYSAEANPLSQPPIGGSLKADANLAYVDFGATDDLPTTITPGIPAPTTFPKRDAPTSLAAGGTGGIDVDSEKESDYAPPDFVGGTTKFPKRDAPTLLAAGGTGVIDADLDCWPLPPAKTVEEESVYAAPDFVAGSGGNDVDEGSVYAAPDFVGATTEL